MSTHLEWTAEISGVTYTAHAEEVRPGVTEVDTSLLRQLMSQVGWTEVSPS